MLKIIIRADCFDIMIKYGAMLERSVIP